MANNLVKNLVSHIQKRFLQSSATQSPSSGTTSSSFTVQYLVNSCGLPLESALSVSQTFQLEEKKAQRAQSVADFLKSHHFSDTQLAKLIAKKPEILQCRVKGNLQPKFDYLIKNGFAGELLPQLILTNPAILRYSLTSQIKPSFEFLRSHLDSDDKILTAVKRSSWLLTSDLKVAMRPNVDFLMKERVSAHNLQKLMTLQPRAIMQKHDRMVYAVNAVKNLGFTPNAPMFIHALRVMISMNESTWKKKVKLFKSMGWEEDEIFLAFQRDPKVLSCSEEKIKNGLNFYLNIMKMDRDTLISYPKFLMYGIEKRMRPRYNVLKVLESEKLIEWSNNIAWLLTINEKKFQKKYVEKYKDDVPGLLDMYPGAKGTKN